MPFAPAPDPPLSSEPESRSCECKKVTAALIVDDNVYNHIPLQELLLTMGVECEQAFGGRQAIEMFIEDRVKTCCENKFQVIFMDLNMPEVDGFQATQKILAFQKQFYEKQLRGGPVDEG